MDQNDILNNKLIKTINKIEKSEAKIRQEKDTALIELRKQISKDTFIGMVDKIIEQGYSDEKHAVEEIKQKEINEQKLEYDDYIAVLRMYDNIAPHITIK